VPCLCGATVLAAAFVFFSVVRAERAPASAPATASAPASTAAVIKWPGLQVDLKKKIIRLSGRFSLEEGVVELIACRKGTKDYESLLALDAEPHKFHAALLLIGLEPGGYVAKNNVPRGGKAKLLVRFKRDGKEFSVPPERFVYNLRDKRAMKPRHWVFVGSRMVKTSPEEPERYWGDLTGAMVTTFLDPSTVLENPGKYREDDTVFVVYKEKVPPLGTKAELIVMPVKEKRKRDKSDSGKK